MTSSSFYSFKKILFHIRNKMSNEESVRAFCVELFRKVSFESLFTSLFTFSRRAPRHFLRQVLLSEILVRKELRKGSALTHKMDRLFNSHFNTFSSFEKLTDSEERDFFVRVERDQKNTRLACSKVLARRLLLS